MFARREIAMKALSARLSCSRPLQGRDFALLCAVAMGLVFFSQPCLAQSPQITSVSPISTLQDQPITITGSGFGTQPPYIGDSPYIQLADEPKNWFAGLTGDQVNLIVASWTDSQIVL